MTEVFNVSGNYKAGRSTCGIAHKFRTDDPAQVPASARTAGTMSILPRRRTNILPRYRRSRVIPAARKAWLRRTPRRLLRKVFARFAPDFPEHLSRRQPAAPHRSAYEQDRKF